MRPAVRSIPLYLLLLTAAASTHPAVADREKGDGGEDRHSGGLSLQAERRIEFQVETGTWLSLDVSPDGSRIVFEMLGDLYLLPMAGGRAIPLTTGMAFDSQPRFSPDGARVVFVSDRSGSENLWTVAVGEGGPAAGEAFEQLTRETGKVEFASPAYAPDGSHVIVSRTTWGLGVFELWAYHVDGGKGVQITKASPNGEKDVSKRTNSLGAVYSPDGRYLYFARRTGGFGYNLSLPLWQVVRRDLRTGDEDTLTQAQGSAFRPALSPDGNTLVYGTRYEQHTGLRRHDLRTGEDTWLAWPVTFDEQESRFTRDLLPGYAFTPDGSAVVYTAAGKLRRVSLASGEVTGIPFEAAVSQELGPRLYFPYRLGFGPVKARMLMGPALSPDASKLAFSSFLALHVFDTGTGQVRTVSPEDARAFDPAWSPDGRELAYVSWSSRGGGHVWRIRADGRGGPRRISDAAGYYSDPAWSPDGQRILVLRAGSYDRLYREWDMGSPTGSDLVWFPRNGGGANLVVPSRGYGQPHFGPEADRIYLYQAGTGLTSLRYDGTDRRNHLVVKGPGLYMAEEDVPASDIRLSPDGRYALALHANQLYLVALLNPNLADLTLAIGSPTLPLARLTDVGADFFGWADGGRTLFWTVGHNLYRRPLAAVRFDEPKDGDGDGDESASSEAVAAGDADKAADERIAEMDPSVETFSVDVYRPRFEPEGTLVLRGATVLTMEQGAETRQNTALVIVNGRIERLVPDAELVVPDAAEVFDLGGAFVLPGLIDTHAHFRPLRQVLDDQNWAFLANLAYGVTTGLDVQPSTTDILAYQDLIDAGLMTGPRALSTGPGIFSNNAFRSAKHAEAVLERYREHYGVRNLKAYLVGNRKQRQYVVEAAKRLKLMPTTEGGLDMKMDLTHVIDGFSGNEHNFPLPELYDDTVELVARSGIAYTPTLLVSYGGPWAENWFYTRQSPDGDAKLRRFMPENVIAARTQRTQWALEEEYVFPELAAQALKIVRAGGRVGVGAHGQLQGLGYHWEMQALAAGGFTPMEVLTAATRHGAEMIGVADDIGTITVGKLADLVVLDADPTVDIRNTLALRYVISNGELFDADTMDKLWPVRVPLPEQWWWHVGPPGESGLPPADPGRD